MAASLVDLRLEGQLLHFAMPDVVNHLIEVLLLSFQELFGVLGDGAVVAAAGPRLSVDFGDETWLWRLFQFLGFDTDLQVVQLRLPFLYLLVVPQVDRNPRVLVRAQLF